MTLLLWPLRRIVDSVHRPTFAAVFFTFSTVALCNSVAVSTGNSAFTCLLSNTDPVRAAVTLIGNEPCASPGGPGTFSATRNGFVATIALTGGFGEITGGSGLVDGFDIRVFGPSGNGFVQATFFDTFDADFDNFFCCGSEYDVFGRALAGAYTPTQHNMLAGRVHLTATHVDTFPVSFDQEYAQPGIRAVMSRYQTTSPFQFSEAISYAVLDADGNPLSSAFVAHAPEPPTWPLMSVGLMLVLLGSRRFTLRLCPAGRSRCASWMLRRRPPTQR